MKQRTKDWATIITNLLWIAVYWWMIYELVMFNLRLS